MDNTLHFFFVGDFFTKSVDNIAFDAGLKQEMSNCDICFCNFEAPIESSSAKINKAGPALCQHVEAAKFIEDQGFNVVGLANNHIGDFGNDGVKTTIGAFHNALLVGAGDFKQAYKLQIKEVKNKKIGFLAFSHFEFGILDKTEDTKRMGGAWINHPIVDNCITEAKKEVDILFVIAHAGIEEIPLPQPEWRERYKQILSLGADAVIGMHPHVPQGWELVGGKPIFYSLGNCYFDMKSDTPFWNNGFAAILEYSDKGLNIEKVLNIKKEENRLFIDAGIEMQEYQIQLCQKLEKAVYMYEFDALIEPLWKNVYERLIFHSVNRISTQYGFRFFVRRLLNVIQKKEDPVYLLNMVRCESHRWIIQRCLEHKIEDLC